MLYRWPRNPKLFFFIPMVLLLFIATACGGTAEPAVIEKEVIRAVAKEVVVVKEVIKEVPKEVIVEKEVVK